MRSTIAQLLFASETAINFAKIVAELQSVLARQNPDGVETAWDHDDLVIFDVAECRILLSWNEVSGNGFSECLCVSVGPSEIPGSLPVEDQLELLCSRLVERIQNRFNPVAVIWRQVEGSVDADLIDTLIERLPGLSPVLLPIGPLLDSIMTEDRLRSGTVQEKATSYRRPESASIKPKPAPTDPSPGVSVASSSLRVPHTPIETASPAGDESNTALELQAKISRVRIALYPPKADANMSYTSVNSIQMRLAAHVLNAALILIWLPLGVAVTTYSLLQGADIRLSACLMAICSTVQVVSQPQIWNLLV